MWHLFVKKKLTIEEKGLDIVEEEESESTWEPSRGSTFKRYCLSCAGGDSRYHEVYDMEQSEEECSLLRASV
jgi:hypothetical protein